MSTQPPLANSTARRVDDPDPSDDELWEEEVSCGQRILAVMRDIGNIAKSDRNETQNFNYRSVERVVAATRDAMIQHGLLCLPTRVAVVAENWETTTASGKITRPRRASLKITYTFMSADDVTDAIETEIVSEALDYGGDKAISQALTAAHKAILLQSFQIGDNGSDQDTGSTGGGDEFVYASEQWHADLNERLGAMSEEQRAILRAAWRRSWGSPRDETVPEAAIQEIVDLILTVEAVGDPGASAG